MKPEWIVAITKDGKWIGVEYSTHNLKRCKIEGMTVVSYGGNFKTVGEAIEWGKDIYQG